MPTGDGLLARVHPPLGVLSAAQLRAVAEAARRHGNGHIDITARGNLQIRGVSAATACDLAASLTDAGLSDVRADGGPQRLTLTSPLAGLDASELIDVPALARAVEAVGLGMPGLPAKTLVAIDGGGRWGLGATEADVFVSATEPGRVAIGLAAEAATDWYGTFEIDGAPAELDRVLRTFVATGQRRMRDLTEVERAKVVAIHAEPGRASSFPHGGGSEFAVAPEPGVIALSAGLAAIVVEAPFGRCTADGLDAVATLAGGEEWADGTKTSSRHSGAAKRNPESRTADGACPGIDLRFWIPGSPPAPRNDGEEAEIREANVASALASRNAIRLAPPRGLILLVSQAHAEATLAVLIKAGFITDPADPRRAVAACPGAPACASGSTPVPDHAADLANAFAPFAARGLTAHVSGCAKGCAHPRKAGLTLVAEDGRYRVLVDAAPGDGAHAPSLTFEEALDRVRRADPARSLAGPFRS